MPEDWVGHTTVNPVSLTVLIVLSIAMFFVPRRWAVVPVILIACFISPAQRIMLLVLNFSFLRIIVLMGLARAFSRGETASFRWRPLDTLVVAFMTSVTIVFTIRECTAESLINRLGESVEIIGPYFFFRIMFRTWSDVVWTTRAFALVSIPIGVVFMIEKSTGHNMFAVLGGVPEMTFIREGRLRCQGAFAHAILAGCFWASLIPLFACTFLVDRRGRWLMGIGIAMSLWIVVACASSTPAAGVIFAVMGGLAYLIRPWLRTLRWSAVAVLVGLHFSMKMPVWHLIARTNIVGGSEGWHRYILIDQAINQFGSWWLVGTSSTFEWGYGLEDITNEVVLWGVRGGFVSMLLFIAIIVVGFRGVGRIVRAPDATRAVRMYGWAVGVCLLVHVASFIGVSYFGQIRAILWMTFAIIGSLEPVRRGARVRAPQPAQVEQDAPAAANSWPVPMPTPATAKGDMESAG